MKPIHKFNGGIGATLCHKCNKIITEGMTDNLYCEEHGGEYPYKYKLIRERDGLTMGANKIGWIEFDESGRGSKLHDEPAIDRSLILEPAISYRWMTTTITEIIEEVEGYVKFKTKNSIYELKYK